MFDFLTNALAFLVALGAIIFVHEAGHLLAAKAFGIRVLTFSLGFGKRLLGFRRGETDYRWSLIPLGGYVKLGGEEQVEVSDDPRDFLNRPRWQRVIVYLAGPVANILLAVVLIAGVFMVGIEIPDLQTIPPVVGEVEAGSSAATAGILPGDRILEVEGKPVTRWQDIGFALMTSPGKSVALRVGREGGAAFDASVVPQIVPRYEFGDSAGLYPQLLPRVTQVLPGSPAATAGLAIGDELRTVESRPIVSPREFVAAIEARPGQVTRLEITRDGREIEVSVTPRDEGGKGKIGVGIGIFQRYGPGRAFVESVRYNVNVARQTFAVLGKIFTREIAAKSALSGPLEIASLSGQAARSGAKNLVYLMGFISISVAILNLLPLPVLDGGQIAMLLIESVLRRDISIRIKERVQQFGFVMLMALMVLVLYFDLSKLLPGSGG